MAEDGHGRPERSSHRALGAEVVVAAAVNHAEAEMVCARLANAGIPAEARRAIGGPEWDPSSGHFIYVQPDQAARAKAALRDAEGFSDDELARLSEESAAESRARLAAREAAEPPEAAADGRGVWARLFRRG